MAGRASLQVLLIQHVWTRWTKRSRGANATVQRVRPDPAYPLPAILPEGQAVCHAIRCLEVDGFALTEQLGSVDTVPERRGFHGLDRLSWRRAGDAMRIEFRPDRQAGAARSPASRPPVALEIRDGQAIRIEWNARLSMSISGGDRSSIYEQHWFSIYFGSRGMIPDLRHTDCCKQVDLTRHIY